jgi:uncharacterized protein
MNKTLTHSMTALALVTASQSAFAGSDVFFNPLTASAVVADPNSVAELTSPWIAPAGISQSVVTDMSQIEADATQSVVRVPGAGTSASMWDMVSFDDRGRFVFIPHETPFGAGVSRFDVKTGITEVLFAGNGLGAQGDWSNDWAAFDPSTYTPHGTLLLAEEWAGEGRVIEIMNPRARADKIMYRELESIANVAHEGLRFSKDGGTLYFVDEWNSGSLYKFVMSNPRDYTRGQTFVLVVDAFAGDPAANYNEGVNATATRVGSAHWIPITDAYGQPTTQVDPFRNGPTDDPRTSSITRGGRPAADEVNGTPYGRPEDIEIGRLANGHEVLYVAVTSENAVYAVEMLDQEHANVVVAASQTVTPKNLGFPATTGALNAPDNLAQDALGNIYVIEDAPNGSSTGGDIWFLRDTDSNGVAESLDHFLSIQVHGSEATGMIFDPRTPTEFVVAVQHPSSTDLAAVPDGVGDALWRFNLTHVQSPLCTVNGRTKPCYKNFVKELKRAHRDSCE